MIEKRVECSTHGNQGMGLLCIHAAIAIDSGTRSGFFQSDNTDLARPDAWCGDCQQKLSQSGWSEEWFEAAEFKIVCAICWDLAKERSGSLPP
jgi:hypothetical protein